MINLPKIWKNLTRALPWLLFVAVCLWGYVKCEGEKRANDNIAVLHDEVKYFENKVGGMTATIGTLQLTKRQLEQQVLAKDDSLKKLVKEFSNVKTVVIVETKFKIDTIRESFEIPVPCGFVRAGQKTEKWYTFKYEVDQNGLSLTNFQTWTETTTVTGFKRKWFLGRQYATTDVTHTNPNITTTSIKSIEVVVPVKWHDTRVFNISVGLLAGALLFNQ